MDKENNTEITKSEIASIEANPLTAQFSNINQGTVAVESSRAIAEAQGKLVIAKNFPRNEIVAYANAMTACQRKGVAEKAFFSYKRGGSTVSGPTIRLAEELARCWGNIDYGIKELSQDDGKSEMQAYAWDMETNTIRTQNFTNPHIREVAGTSKPLTSQRDIYEANANMGARRMRACIFAVLPSDLVDNAIAMCKKTLAGSNDIPLIDKVKKLVVCFSKLGVTQEVLESKLHKKIENMDTDDYVEYVGIYNGIKNGESKVADWFDAKIYADDLSKNLLGDDK